MDRELYLPQSWTDDRERCRAAKIPDGRVFATKPELARATAGAPVQGETSGHGAEVAQDVECAGELAGISAAEPPHAFPELTLTRCRPPTQSTGLATHPGDGALRQDALAETLNSA